jgi:hypothetical protein
VKYSCVDSGARAAGRLAVVLVDEDQVDVRRHVQLAAAELAHPDHAEHDALAVGAARLAVGGLELRGQQRERALHGHFGEIGHRGRDLGDVRDAAQVALRHRAEHLDAQLPQRALSSSPGAAAGTRREQLGEARVEPRARERRVGPRGDQLGQRGARGDRAGEIAGIGRADQGGSVGHRHRKAGVAVRPVAAGRACARRCRQTVGLGAV